MHQRTIVRAMLIGGLTFAAWTAHECADDGAAQAADRKPGLVAEQPGGVLGHLPEQAADRAREVVDQVAADKPAPPKAKPTPAPEPTRTETPAPPADDPGEEPEPPASAPPADPIVVDLPTDPIVDVPPIVVETPPIVVAPTTDPAPTTGPIVITLPAIGESPLPDADDLPLPLRDQPSLIQVTAVALPALPVLIGPAPAAEHGQMEPAAAVATLKVPDCADRPDDARSVNRDAIRQLITKLTEPAATPRAKPAHGCPGTPGHPLDPRADCASTGATSSTQTGNGHTHADLAGSLTAPALARLTHARARSSIPAGRHTAIEPGPA